MSREQLSLGDEGIAEELARGQRAISIAEFFEKNKQMLGFDSGARALVTAVKEGVDNSLDASEEADILPDIYVEIEEVGDYFRVVIEDNGPGITKDQIPKVFGKLLYGSRFHVREQSLAPDQRVLVRRDNGPGPAFVTISDLCDSYLPDTGAATAPVPDNVRVPSFNRETQEMSWEPVTHAIRHETDTQTYEITTEKRRTVEVTGNHSLFSVTDSGETKEVTAADLACGDRILAPRRLPSPHGTVEEVNLLEYITTEQLQDRSVYVYGFDEETLAELRTGETVRKKPSEDSPRERYYYRYRGVDILRDSLEQNYIEKCYLPAETVLELGWEEKARECEFRTYRVGGDETTMPVTVRVDDSFVDLLAYYISEGHVGPRQVGFTFGSHEEELISATEKAAEGITGSTTRTERDNNSTRVKVFGSPLALFLQATCGDSSRSKQIPGFVFHMEPELQKRFIAAIYQGDGSDAHPMNQLEHCTTSERLSRQLSVLWNMQGVLASTEVDDLTSGYADGATTYHQTNVYGPDVEVAGIFEATRAERAQQHKRIPVSMLDEVSAGGCSYKTVPDSVPGLLMGAGVGASIEHANEYRKLIGDAMAGEYVEKPRYVHNLKEKGLLDQHHRPTKRLETLWDRVQNLQGLTDTDMCLLPVKNVEPTDPPEYVYDISVPGATGYDENFVVANEGALCVKNSRGQQGIGISAAVLYSQLTSGKPVKITSRTMGGESAQYFEVTIDTEANEPEIETHETTTWDRPHGIRIEMEMEANLRARQRLQDYIEYTAVVNPHARIEFREPKSHRKFERATDQLPEDTEEIRPHPHGVELGTLQKMLEATDSYSMSGFLQGEFTRVGGTTADKVIDNFRDRHFGRAFSWQPPGSHVGAPRTDSGDGGDGDGGANARRVDPERAIADAVANKGKEATTAFARRVADDLDAADRLAHHDVVAIVDDVADDIQEEFDATFGTTVRKNAVAAAWSAVTAERAADLYRLVDEATTSRKDDAHVRGLAERIAAKFDNADDPGDRVTRGDLREYVDRAADMAEEHGDATFGETARENVLDALWLVARRVPEDPPKVRALANDRDLAAALLEAMREADILAPPTECLSPITEELVEAGLKKEYDADFYAAATRDAEVHGGDPFVVEAGIAYGGELAENEDGQVDILRFANRVSLVYKRGGCAITHVIKDINWRNYGLDQPGGSGIPNGPAVLLVHVASTNVPFTSESKDAVADIPEIEDEIELALREAARELKSYLNRRRSMEKRRRKRDQLATILPEMAAKLAEVTGREPLHIDDSLARIMNNVLVDREVEDGTVRLTVENNTDANVDLELTDIVSAEPAKVNGATVVEVDGEWFVKWSPTVTSGGETTLEYTVEGDPTFDLSIDGVTEEKLTVTDQ